MTTPTTRVRTVETRILPDTVHPQFTIDRPGRIIVVEHHLSTTRTLRCRIRRISVDGAALEISPHLTVPGHFFLEILGISDEIGCTLIRREAEKLTVGFNMLIDPDFLDHVVHLNLEPGR